MSTPTQGERPFGATSVAPFLALVWAGLAGASGVALAAAAAHKVESPALASAATMLIVHAVLAVALIAIAFQSRCAKLWWATAFGILFAASLFSGSIALRALTGEQLFPMSAPIGGTLMMVGWIVIAILGLAHAVRKR
ncbi:DUF423 domain-containing protein [Hyphomicrobium methylovorum]|uniref:DUF423 domain-containing protein n=1 Tax=Hyphomicrobium methylovorum TaxID=84 RepID=UPI0015E74ABA|nr:DUF423 domain-containing protein [Hyphomicrobium methylovorum]MBA2125200.1 DUF423 domain-containing protein [Hyphomicrobium methylovorum]